MNARPFTILIVSPDRANLRRLSKFLDVFGYDVWQATDGSAALAAAEAARPDFLIVDGASGEPADLQLCRSVRRLATEGYTYSLLLAERRDVGEVTSALEAGFDDFLAAPIIFGELLARLRAGARFIEYERRVREQAGADLLTGLADKSALTAELSNRLQSSKSPAGWLALLELDYFQRVANRLGQSGADELLRQAAEQIRGRCESGCIAARLSGDRIAIVLPASGRETAAAWCEATLSGLAETRFTFLDQVYRLTASCGLAELAAGDTVDATQARAQRALQLARSSGGNCVVTTSEVDEDADAWAAYAADGKLFETTTARDVMHPWPLVLQADETLEQAYALLSQTGLDSAPVVDGEGSLAGMVTLDKIAAARLRTPKPKSPSASSSSVRLVRHLMSAEVTRFEEATPLGTLMEFFTGENASFAVIVRAKKPRGVVHCHALAALNERLTADHFAATQPRTGTSADLLVPDLALAE
jgi:two-component system, cell cycle response regulator